MTIRISNFIVYKGVTYLVGDVVSLGAADERSLVNVGYAQYVTGSSDTTAPTAPTSVSAVASGATAVVVSWAASSDDVAVTGYRVYREAVLVASVSGGSLTYTDNTAMPATTYTYSVRAVDAAGNESLSGTAPSVTTPGTGGGTASGAAGGDLTGTYPNPTIAAGAVTPAKIGASGSPNATTFLRGDGQWASPSGLAIPTLVRAPDTTLLWDGTNGGTPDAMNRAGINTSEWTYDLGGGQPGGAGNEYNRWGNWEAQNYTDALKNVFVKNGMLHIRAFKEVPQIASPVTGQTAADYSSGRIHSQGKVTIPVGAYVEARITCPTAPGTWPAFWAMGVDYVRTTDAATGTSTSNWPYCGEIDGFEGFGQHLHSAGFALHMTATGVPNDTNAYTSDLYVGWDNFDSVYRNETLDISTPTYYGWWNSGTEIRRYVNRRETFRYTQDDATASGRAWPFNQDVFLILNLATGGQAEDGNPPLYLDRGMGAEMTVEPVTIWTGVGDPAALGLA